MVKIALPLLRELIRNHYSLQFNLRTSNVGRDRDIKKSIFSTREFSERLVTTHFEVLLS